MRAEIPRGFGFTVPNATSAPAEARLHETGKLLERIGASAISAGGNEADTAPPIDAGVPGLALRTSGAHYFDWHHSQADTLDKVDPEDFRRNVAALAVMAFVLADMPDKLAGTAR